MNDMLEWISSKKCLLNDVAEFYEKLNQLLPEQRLAVIENEGPLDMDTLGTLIDKLVTVDLKMWHNQEALYAIRRMSQEQFLQTYGNDLGELHGIIKRCCDLNVQRATLMDAIDQHLSDIFEGKRQADVRLQHKTY